MLSGSRGSETIRGSPGPVRTAHFYRIWQKIWQTLRFRREHRTRGSWPAERGVLPQCSGRGVSAEMDGDAALLVVEDRHEFEASA